jgi:hypothetical protein
MREPPPVEGSWLDIDSVSPVLWAPTVSAWGLLRLGAQKRKREQQRGEFAVEGSDGLSRAARHALTVASARVSVQASVEPFESVWHQVA